jgi:two-component system, LytTR family, response regulator
MVKSIIVEDEVIHSNDLKQLLQSEPEVEVIAVCKNIDAAEKAINQHRPKLVFLDIQLGDDSKAGFKLLRRLGKINFDVIFTTAHIDANINDIRLFGLDYLPKPYDPDELSGALKKYYEKKPIKVENDRVTSFVDNMLGESPAEQIVWLNDERDLLAAKLKNILYAESAGNNTGFLCFDEESKKHITLRSPHRIGEWEKFFEKSQLFYRIHNEYLVNFMHIRKYINGDGGQVLLSNKKCLDVAKRRKEGLLRRMNKL